MTPRLAVIAVIFCRNDYVAPYAPYDAIGDTRASFRELGWEIPVYYGRAVRKAPNASNASKRF